MKNTFKVEISALYYFVGFFCFLTGYFKDFIWISMLIMIHECGHVTGAILCNWKIERVLILPFGGMTFLKEHLNRPMHQEWLIVLLGPIYQMICFQILSVLHYTNSTFMMYHFLLLGFNLLPILPLDGSKILQLCLESIVPYKRAKYVGFWISVFLILFLIGYTLSVRNILLGVILLFLIKENINFYYHIPYQMEKFLLERYLNSYSFHKCCLVKKGNLSAMKRGYHHLFWKQSRWKTEKEVLSAYFARNSFDKVRNL